MSYATAWFLVLIGMGGAQYLGPLSQQSCQEAAAALRGEAVVCRQASSMTYCQIPNQPGVGTSCPVFEGAEQHVITEQELDAIKAGTRFPWQVTVKP